MRDDLDDLVARHAVVERAPDVAAQLLRGALRDERRYGDEAAIALGGPLSLPDIAEPPLVGELAHLGKHVAALADGRVRVSRGHEILLSIGDGRRYHQARHEPRARR